MTEIKKFIKFLDESVTSFHAVSEIKKSLIANGYEKLEGKVEFNKKYFITKNDSSIIAFQTPLNEKDFHFQITAAHTDSPTYKLKPIHEVTSLKHYKSLNTEVYGGPIHQTWFDKPLSIAGRIFIESKNKITQKLVKIDKDLLVIPSLAIHLNENSNKMTYNPQIDLQPLYGVNLDGNSNNNILDLFKEDNIVSADLFLYNRQRGQILGINDDFILAPQLDDLAMCYINLEAFINSSNSNCNMFVAFDNEEVGSQTKQGAASTFLKDLTYKIHSDLKIKNDYSNVIDASFLISSDNAHAIHPNYIGKMDPQNYSLINKGIAIKHNANQRYTTDAFSAAVFKKICKLANCNYQEIANRSDIRGGSTLGNISTTQLSVNSVDIGLPQLAMHSATELVGTKDFVDLITIIKKFYNTKIIIKDQTVDFKEGK